MTQKFETRIIHQRVNVLFAPGEEIVHTNDVMPVVEQTLAEMGTKKPSSARDRYRFIFIGVHKSISPIVLV